MPDTPSTPASHGIRRQYLPGPAGRGCPRPGHPRPATGPSPAYGREPPDGRFTGAQPPAVVRESVGGRPNGARKSSPGKGWQARGEGRFSRLGPRVPSVSATPPHPGGSRAVRAQYQPCRTQCVRCPYSLHHRAMHRILTSGLQAWPSALPGLHAPLAVISLHCRIHHITGPPGAIGPRNGFGALGIAWLSDAARAQAGRPRCDNRPAERALWRLGGCTPRPGAWCAPRCGAGRHHGSDGGRANSELCRPRGVSCSDAGPRAEISVNVPPGSPGRA